MWFLDMVGLQALLKDLTDRTVWRRFSQGQLGGWTGYLYRYFVIHLTPKPLYQNYIVFVYHHTPNSMAIYQIQKGAIFIHNNLVKR